MTILFCLVALLSCTIGKICGMGGGVLIKLVLDAFGILRVETINFYSACTVTAMSGWSVGKSLKGGERQLDLPLYFYLRRRLSPHAPRGLRGDGGKELRISSVSAKHSERDAALRSARVPGKNRCKLGGSLTLAYYIGKKCLNKTEVG